MTRHLTAKEVTVDLERLARILMLDLSPISLRYAEQTPVSEFYAG